MSDAEFYNWAILIVSVVWLVCELFADPVYPDTSDW